VADPIGTVESGYAYFGLPLSGAAADAMRALRGPSATGGARSAHRYTLADFGLTGEEIDERFGGYQRARA
jgi:hypothetical protein